MTDYKIVFQLAQSKGYKPSMLFNDFYFGQVEENVYPDVDMVEISLIQKWLRDEHNKEVVVLSDDTDSKERWEFSVYPLWDTHRMANGNQFLSYEDALLNGIHEALTLIP